MKKISSSPLFWGTFIATVCQVLTLYLVPREKAFIEAEQIVAPEVGTSFAIIYFLATVAVMGIVLWLLPARFLKIVIRFLFVALYSWGVLVFASLAFPMPLELAVILAVASGVARLIFPKVWLHDLLMALALVSSGAVFGFIFAPWAVIVILLAISIYDVLAVRIGYMLWMVSRLGAVEIPPAFIIPKEASDWNLSLKGTVLSSLLDEKPSEREFSILGGGDIGLPLAFVVSVAFAYGFAHALIVAVFSVLGVAFAYLIQIFLFKGKPLPALLPITALALLGFLVAITVL